MRNLRRVISSDSSLKKTSGSFEKRGETTGNLSEGLCCCPRGPGSGGKWNGDLVGREETAGPQVRARGRGGAGHRAQGQRKGRVGRGTLRASRARTPREGTSFRPEHCATDRKWGRKCSAFSDDCAPQPARSDRLPAEDAVVVSLTDWGKVLGIPVVEGSPRRPWHWNLCPSGGFRNCNSRQAPRSPRAARRRFWRAALWGA